VSANVQFHAQVHAENQIHKKPLVVSSA